MAYRFDGVDDQVDFDRAPFTGYAFGPLTIAAFVKFNATVANQTLAGLVTATSVAKGTLRQNAGTTTPRLSTGASANATGTWSSGITTTPWYLYCVTWAGAGTVPRFHKHDGTSWQHVDAGASIAANTAAVVAGDFVRVGSGSGFLNGDMVCAGIDKANHTDGEIETLSRTLFQAWLDFGFDWLVGFEAAGTIVDKGTAATGDELSRTGTTLVSDPAGWTWPGITTHYGAIAMPVAFAVATAGTAYTPVTYYGAISRAAVFSAATAGDVSVGATLYGAVSRAIVFAAATAGVESSSALPPPEGLAVIPMSTTQINLDWEPSPGATSYRVERATSGGAYVEIATTGATSYADTGLDPSTYYAYRVRGDDGSDVSGYTGGRTGAVTDVLPTEGVSLAFGSALLDANPGWTRIDVGSVVAEYNIRRGRQDELEKAGTGTAAIRLNDRTGAFAPGDLDGRQVALALWNPVTATSHTVFRGFADTYNYDVHPSGFVTYVDIEAVDALDYLAGCEVAPIFNGVAAPPGVTVAAGDVYYAEADIQLRIHDLLDEVDWPDELRTIFTGNVYVKQQVAAASTSILSLLMDACDAEWPGVANLYASKLGKVTFHGRLARFNPEATAASAGTAWKFTRWKAGDGSATGDPSYAQLRGLSFTRQRQRIINRALAYPYRADGVEPQLSSVQMEDQVVIDQPSIDAYGLHSWSAESLMTHRHKTDAPLAPNKDLKETRLMAKYYVENYKEPQTRLTRLEFRSLRPEDPRAAATWALMCGVEISDIVSVKSGAAGFDDAEFFVEGISYDVRAAGPEYADVTLSLDVSPVAYYDHYPTDDE